MRRRLTGVKATHVKTMQIAPEKGVKVSTSIATVPVATRGNFVTSRTGSVLRKTNAKTGQLAVNAQVTQLATVRQDIQVCNIRGLQEKTSSEQQHLVNPRYELLTRRQQFYGDISTLFQSHCQTRMSPECHSGLTMTLK